MKYKDQKVNLTETLTIKDGVICSVYEFDHDNTKDLGIMKVSKGYKTPLQKVLSGEKTIEIFESGVGILTITGVNGHQQQYNFPSKHTEVEVKIGEIMQWEAIEDMTFFEICYPPYQEGRFKDIGN